MISSEIGKEVGGTVPSCVPSNVLVLWSTGVQQIHPLNLGSLEKRFEAAFVMTREKLLNTLLTHPSGDNTLATARTSNVR